MFYCALGLGVCSFDMAVESPLTSKMGGGGCGLPCLPVVSCTIHVYSLSRMKIFLSVTFSHMYYLFFSTYFFFEGDDNFTRTWYILASLSLSL